MAKDTSRIEALEQLLAERRRHEGFLAKLEERRATTPAHVFARLRDEYLTKLTDLQFRSLAEADILAEGVGIDQSAVDEIDAKLAAVQEERLEGELRAEVGELEAKDWTKRLTVLNATIAQLEKERDAKTSAYERVTRLVEEARSGLAASPRPTAPGAPQAPAAGAPAVPADTSGSGPSRMTHGPSFDELAFLNSVVGRQSTPPPVNPVPPVPRASRPVVASDLEPNTGASNRTGAIPAPAAVPQADPQPSAPPPAPPPPPVAAAPPPPAPAPEPVAAAAPAAPAPQPEAPKAVPQADDEPSSPLGRPTPRTSQAIKTLKCQECGTFNYPTEWYCERCGGELAAL